MAPFNQSNLRLVRELKHTRPLIGCRFDPTGRFLFVSSEDDSIQRLDLLTGTKTALVGHTSWVRGLAFIAAKPVVNVDTQVQSRPADNLLAAVGVGGMIPPVPKPTPFTLISADYHGKLIWWDGLGSTPKPIRTVTAHDGWVRAVAISPDGQTVASCGNDNLVKLWKAADGTAIRTLEGHESHVYNVAFHPAGEHLVSCDLKGMVKDWNWSTGKCERNIDTSLLAKYDPVFMAVIGGARGLAFQADGKELALCGITNVSNAFAGVGNPAVMLIDWKEAKPQLLKLKDTYPGTAWGVGYHPSGMVIAAGGGSGGRVWFWTPKDHVNSFTLTVPMNCRDLALSPSGQLFALAGANGTASVYRIENG